MNKIPVYYDQMHSFFALFKTVTDTINLQQNLDAKRLIQIRGIILDLGEYFTVFADIYSIYYSLFIY